jgi:hypothetical protein
LKSDFIFSPFRAGGCWFGNHIGILPMLTDVIPLQGNEIYRLNIIYMVRKKTIILSSVRRNIFESSVVLFSPGRGWCGFIRPLF